MVVLGHIEKLHEVLGERKKEAADGGIQPPDGGIIAPVSVPGQGL